MSTTAAAENKVKPFESKLGTGRERFLVQVMVHSLEAGWRTPDDFLRHFPAKVLIESLAKADDLRTSVLTKAAKVHEKLALKKSIASGAEDLAIALDEGLCVPRDILDVYPPDDRVRYLQIPKLWEFVTEGAFWQRRPDDSLHARAVGRMVFFLERALAESLIKLEDLGDGMSFGEIAKRLPLPELQRVVEHALTIGRSGKALTEKTLLDAVPLATLVGHIPLDHIWQRIVVAKIASPLGFGEAADRITPGPAVSSGTATPPGATSHAAHATASPPSAATPAATSGSATVSAVANSSAVAPSPAIIPSGPERTSLSDSKTRAAEKPSAPEKPVNSQEVKAAETKAVETKPVETKATASKDEDDGDSDGDHKGFDDINVEEDELLFDASDTGDTGGVGSEASVRQNVLDRLRSLERLPPGHASLPLPILASIESMYADLQNATQDDERESVIRDSFPNESHLRTAMLSLIELLDPTIDTTEPLIRDADVDSLVKIVLFEERRRYERAHPSRPPASVAAASRSRVLAGGRSKPAPSPLSLDEELGRKR